MNRPQLEHILRAAAAITGADQFVIIGSQAILGQFPNPPSELAVSIEADIFSLRKAEDAELIDCTFGYHAHGVGQETAKLPEGWKDRLVQVHNPNTGGATGLCLDVHDLAVSKLVAGRQKDLDFVAGLLRHQLVNPEVVQDRLEQTSLAVSMLQECSARLQRLKSFSG